MERVLLWFSLVVGLIVYFCRFLPVANPRPESGEVSNPSGDPLTRSSLRIAALLAPLLGLFFFLPPVGRFLTHSGVPLGLGYILGGAVALLNHPVLLFRRNTPRPALTPLSVASLYGLNIAAVVITVLYLSNSIQDALMGLAMGTLCVSFVLHCGLPSPEHGGRNSGRLLATGATMMAALCSAVSIGIYRDAITPELTKLTWSALLVAFTALGALLVAGTALAGVSKSAGIGRLIPLTLLIVIGGLGLYQMATKLSNTPQLAFIGIGGLLLWPVALLLAREAGRRGGAGVSPMSAVPFLSVLVIVSGLLASLQSLQGIGIATGVLALFLSFAATIPFLPSDDSRASGELEPVGDIAVGLLIFSATILLWRHFAIRWEGELRGVTLTDQYALFGLLVGACIPGLLASLPGNATSGQNYSGTARVIGVCLTGALTVLAPAAVLVLFGPKSASALMIGLALGAVPALNRIAPLLPGLISVAVALALIQFTGSILPAESPTRIEKIRYLAIVMSAIVFSVIISNLVGGRKPVGGEAEK